MIIKQLHVDLWQKILQPVTVVQHEAEGRRLAITLTGGGLPVNLTGCDVIFYAQKPDENILFNNCVIVDEAAGQVEYTITEQTVVLAGTLKCWIVVIKDGATIRSQEFHVTVQGSPDFAGAVESTSEFTDLEVALATIAGFDARFTAVEGDIDGLDTRLGTAEGDIDGLDTRLGTAEGDIDGLQDAFESGTWTPRLYGATTAGNPTFSTQLGLVYRSNDWVYIIGYISMTSKGGMQGGIRLTDLPYPISQATGTIRAWIHGTNVTRTGITGLALLFSNPDYAIVRTVYTSSDTLRDGSCDDTHIADDSNFYFEGFYRTAL